MRLVYIYIYNDIVHLSGYVGTLRDAVANVFDCEIVVIMFELQSY